MTPAQASLLRACIEADRAYRSDLAAGRHTEADWRGVEVRDGFSPYRARTAYTLEAAGLVECVNLHGNRSTWAFLGRYRPLDD